MGSGLRRRGWWLCLLLCVAPRAWGVQATLVGDAHVSAVQPSVNSGSLSNLNVGGGYTALVQFNFDVLPVGTTAAQITRATLRVYLNRADVTGTVSVQSVQGAWNESAVTYSNLPPLGAVVQTAQAGTSGQFVTFDVTPLVQAWVSEANANYGMALTASSAVVQFDSKENDQTAHAPQLEIALAAGGAGSNGLPGATGATGSTGQPVRLAQPERWGCREFKAWRERSEQPERQARLDRRAQMEQPEPQARLGLHRRQEQPGQLELLELRARPEMQAWCTRALIVRRRIIRRAM